MNKDTKVFLIESYWVVIAGRAGITSFTVVAPNPKEAEAMAVVAYRAKHNLGPEVEVIAAQCDPRSLIIPYEQVEYLGVLMKAEQEVHGD